MKVLTVKQPYASLIAYGIKEFEFRTWKTKYRGEVLIHAGKSVDKEAMEEFKCYDLECPTGCIIAKVSIDDVIKVDYDFRNILKEKNKIVYKHVIDDESWNGYGFKIGNAELIEPIYIKGKLGLWNYDGLYKLKGKK